MFFEDIDPVLKTFKFRLDQSQGLFGTRLPGIPSFEIPSFQKGSSPANDSESTWVALSSLVNPESRIIDLGEVFANLENHKNGDIMFLAKWTI